MTERGTLLGGRYELDQIIGRGGLGELLARRNNNGFERICHDF